MLQLIVGSRPGSYLYIYVYLPLLLLCSIDSSSMADYLSSDFLTSSFRLDWPTIESEEKDNRKYVEVSDGGAKKFDQPRKVILHEVRVGLNGSFYGSNRNVRGVLQVSTVQSDGNTRALCFIPFGGYMYHDDYGYYEAAATIRVDQESGYVPIDEDWKTDVRVSIIDENGLTQNCDVTAYVVVVLRVKY